MERRRPARAADAELRAAVASLRRLAQGDPTSLAALLLEVLDSTPLDQVLAAFHRRCSEREEQLDREFAELLESDGTGWRKA